MDARRRQKHALPLGLIGMLALVSVVELCIGRSTRFSNDMAESWRIKASAAAREAPGCDVLCFGDSLVEFGVLTPLLDKLSNGKSYNLAVHNGTPSASYFLLERALAAGSRPRAVVVDFSPFQVVMHREYERIRLRAWPELAGLREAIDLAVNLGGGRLFGSILIGRSLPSVDAREEIREAIASDLAGKVRPLNDVLLVPSTRANMVLNRGTMVMPTSGRRPDPTPINLDLESREFDPLQLAYVDRFLRLAADRGIAVFWVVMPISPEYQKIADDSGHDALYGEFVRRFAGRYPNVVVVDGRRTPGYTSEYFMDSIHLSGDGATALTCDLAALMGDPRSIPASRRVALPPCRLRPLAMRPKPWSETREELARDFRGPQSSLR